MATQIEEIYNELYRKGMTSLSILKEFYKMNVNKNDLLTFLKNSREFNRYDNLQDFLYGQGRHERDSKFNFDWAFSNFQISNDGAWDKFGLIGDSFGIIDFDKIWNQQRGKEMLMVINNQHSIEYVNNFYSNSRGIPPLINADKEKIKNVFYNNSMYMYSDTYVEVRPFLHTTHDSRFHRVIGRMGNEVVKAVNPILYFLESELDNSYMIVQLLNCFHGNADLIRELCRNKFVSMIQSYPDRRFNVLRIHSKPENEEVAFESHHTSIRPRTGEIPKSQYDCFKPEEVEKFIEQSRIKYNMF